MKFNKLLIFPLTLSLFGGVSCSNKNKITIEQKENIDSFVYLNDNDLSSLITSKQDFVLVVGENGCSTCEIIKPVIIDFIKKYEYIIYWIENKNYQNVVDKFIESKDVQLDANIMSATIILFDNGSTKEVIEYTDNLYYSESKLEVTLENRIQKSHIYSLNKLEAFDYSKKMKMYKYDLSSTEELEEKIKEKETSIILFAWGPCPDCIRVKDDVLDEYMSASNKKIYVFEVSHFRNDFSTNPELFTNFAEQFKFNNYRGGKLPCLVKYNSNEKVNMHVYFNDEIEKQEDGSYKIVNSFSSSLINSSFKSGEKMMEELRKTHKELLIEYLDNNL
jgi:thiol-disulfide isomerase/thioredoxin